MTQQESNPFPFSNSNKRYYTYPYYLQHTFGFDCAKLTLDAGFTCPNIDGTCGVGGCIYCSKRGSGDFSPDAGLSVREQIRIQKDTIRRKRDITHWIAYFQAHTNTYAPIDVLHNRFEEALGEEEIVGLNIATRADCLPPEVLSYLAELSGRTRLTVELGLQSSNDCTAKIINRGHDFTTFRRGFQMLREADERIRIGIHLIFGLPGEDDETMLQTVRDTAALHPDEVKIHLLYVLNGTELERMYRRGDYKPLDRDRYVRLVVNALELLPPDTVIARLTGDGNMNELIAPQWSRNKITVLNSIDKLLYEQGSMQGIRYHTKKPGRI